MLFTGCPFIFIAGIPNKFDNSPKENRYSEYEKNFYDGVDNLCCNFIDDIH